MSEIIKTDNEYVANTYARFPLVLKEGKGSLVYDETGREYIDMGSGIGVTAYTDVWVSMGEPESVWEERISDLMPYQVNRTLMDNAGPGCRFMHCLPAFHDLETETGRAI